MSANNGVIRIGRKGIKKFAFGEDGTPFDVDVVVAFQRWIEIDNEFRQDNDGSEGRLIALSDIPLFHKAAVEYVRGLSGSYDVTTAEALDFIARLREEYDKLADFFQPKSLEELASPSTSEAASELQFSEER